MGSLFFRQDSPMEEMITRDISRTFTAHEKFQTEDEGGQEAMLKISKVQKKMLVYTLMGHRLGSYIKFLLKCLKLGWISR